MSFLDHVRACNNASSAAYLPFVACERQVGWVKPSFALSLARFPEVFATGDGRVRMVAEGDLDARSAAVAAVCATLVGQGLLPPPRGELYPVAARWGEVPALLLERRHVAAFGVRAHGVHVNGYTRREGRIFLWIGRRAQDKDVAPGKLDNMVAGGQPHGLGLMENLVKEAWEEAGIQESLARTARPAGLVSYLMEDAQGLKPDTLFLYDLEVPADFVPHNTDGEIEAFFLVDALKVAERVRTGFDFKFNVNLVIVDFLIRHGLIGPETEPDYQELVAGLRRF